MRWTRRGLSAPRARLCTPLPSLAARRLPPAADPALVAPAAYSRAGKPLDYPVPSLPSLKALQPQSKPIHLHPALLVTSALLLVRQRPGLEGASSGQSARLSLLDWDFVALGRGELLFIQVMCQGKQPQGFALPSLQPKPLARWEDRAAGRGGVGGR